MTLHSAHAYRPDVARRTHGTRPSPAPTGRSRVLAAAAALLAATLFASGSCSAESVAGSVAPPDAEAIATALVQKYDAGVTRAIAPAQAAYRQAIAMDATGDPVEAIRLLEASAAFDPEYPDPHFTMSRIILFRDPGRAAAEFSEGFRNLARSYPWQRHVLANTMTGLIVVWMLGLLLAVIGIVFRHLPHLLHIVQELLNPCPSRGVKAAATIVSVSPVFWGLGVIPTATLFAGLLSFRFGKREALIMAVFLVSALCLAAGIGAIAPWAGTPTLEEPSLLVDRAMKSAYDPDLAAALLAWQGLDSTEPLFPFALGSMARRSGDLDLAERQLTQAAILKPRTAWILTNLGNVYFAREDYARARQTYEAAAATAPGSVEPHYNLAQVHTKQLEFTEASREQSRASGIAFDRVRDFSRWSAPQLNRTVMDAKPPLQSLWNLARRFALPRGHGALEGNRVLRWLMTLVPPAPFALVFIPALFLIFAGIGQLLGRGLATLHCSACQRIVCRRCVKRMQQRAFCEVCFQTVKDLKSTEFTRLLLTRQGRTAARRRTTDQAILTFLLPGAGQMLRGASLSGFVAILVMTLAALLVLADGALVPSLDVLPLATGAWAKRIPLLILFLLTYGITLARYFSTTTTRVQNWTTSPTRSGAATPTRERERESRRT